MKKIITVAAMFFIFISANAQFATYSYMSFDKDDQLNFYDLELHSMRGIEFWATLTVKGDTENYTISCDVETVGDIYIIRYKHPDEETKGTYWQDEYMGMVWENEDQPILFTIEQKVGEVITEFKHFKCKNAEMPKGETPLGFIVVD